MQVILICNYNSGMIICVCNAIRDKQLEGILAEGASSVCEAFRKMGCQPVCGKCVPEMRDAIQSRYALCAAK
ncbi:MAG: (2Fe-2S)-binding protein [Alphaproteobacteria bacterium]|nr:(2Fe-2S)-binding protein [Alphaproteobacteria bacterium]